MQFHGPERMRRQRGTRGRRIAIAAALGLAGCVMGPMPPSVPASDRAAPPAVEGAAATGFHYSCGRWLARPAVARVVADLRLTRPATAEDEAAVRRQGGAVVHRFHVPVLRIAVATDAIPRLVDGEVIADAVGVRDPRRRDVPLRVRYTHPPGAGELARIAALGIRVAPDQADRVLAGDAAIPALRALPFVAAVAPDVPFCPGE